MKTRTICICNLASNSGPSNVCKYLKLHSKNIIFYNIRDVTPLRPAIANFITFLRSDVVIVGTFGKMNYYLAALSKLLCKKIIYLMHGYVGFESEINHSKNAQKNIRNETKLLNRVDLILPVSEEYRNFFLGLRPEYASKTHFLTNGIDIEEFKKLASKSHTKTPNTIIACGANRFIKKNSKICEAIDLLNLDNPKYTLDIYGTAYRNNERLQTNQFVTVHGRIPQQELYKKLSQARLFVLNAQVESFGLSVLDALACGCNVLVSSKAGITSILKLKPTDLIYDCNDKKEIAEKIQYNLAHNNNDRIVNSIDFEHYSWSSVAKRLEKIARYIHEGKEIETIK